MQVVIPTLTLQRFLSAGSPIASLSLFEPGAFLGISIRICGIPKLLVFENPENHQGDYNGNQQEFHIPAIFRMNGRLEAQNPGPQHGSFQFLTESRVNHPHLADDGILFSRDSGRIISTWDLIGWTSHSHLSPTP